MRLENWQLKAWRLFLRAVRAVTLTVDDWVQAQELKLREPAARAAAQAEVDPAASAAREKEFSGQRFTVSVHRERQAAGAGFTPRVEKSLRQRCKEGWATAAVNGARHSQHSRPEPRMRKGAPRLRYQHGEFVRVGGAA